MSLAKTTTSGLTTAVTPNARTAPTTGCLPRAFEMMEPTATTMRVPTTLAPKSGEFELISVPRECQKVVGPDAICIGAQVFGRGVDDTHVHGVLPVSDDRLAFLILDPIDHGCPGGVTGLAGLLVRPLHVGDVLVLVAAG